MKSLLLRRRLVTAEVGKPYDAEVEYLQSDGTQYIDTLEYFNGLHTKVYLRYSALLSKYFVIGTGSTNNSASFIFANGGGNGTTYNFYFFRYKNNYFSNSMGAQTTAIREAELTNDFVVDGTTIKTWTASDFTTPVTIYLFSQHKGDGTVGTCGSFRIYACKIYQNGVLVRDFIPVRKGQVGYMFDKVSGELFGNLGTVDFILGPDV